MEKISWDGRAAPSCPMPFMVGEGDINRNMAPTELWARDLENSRKMIIITFLNICKCSFPEFGNRYILQLNKVQAVDEKTHCFTAI